MFMFFPNLTHQVACHEKMDRNWPLIAQIADIIVERELINHTIAQIEYTIAT